jgi:uncharacterized protein affecting Mg2+/Co2+ transport
MSPPTSLHKLSPDCVDVICTFLPPRQVLGVLPLVSKRLAAEERTTFGHYNLWLARSEVLKYAETTGSKPLKYDAWSPRDRFLWFARDEGMLAAADVYGPLARAHARFAQLVDVDYGHEAGEPNGLGLDAFNRIWGGALGKLRPPPELRALYAVEARGGCLGTAQAYHVFQRRHIASVDEAIESLREVLDAVEHASQPGAGGARRPVWVPLVLEFVRISGRSQQYYAPVSCLVAISGSREAGGHVRLVPNRPLCIFDPDRGTGNIYPHQPPTSATNVPLIDFILMHWRGAADGSFAVGDGAEGIPPPGPSLFPAAHEQGARQATTEGVTVRAAPVYNAVTNSFAYEIQMALRPGGVHRRVRLLSRVWILENSGTGYTDRVEGDGVIGYYPVLEPLDESLRPNTSRPSSEWRRYSDVPAGGLTDEASALVPFNSRGWFTYVSQTSAVTAPTPTVMRGHFRFVDEETGDEFDAQVPPFSMLLAPMSPSLISGDPE